MGLAPESSHHEKGRGKNEIVFKYHDALETADNLITFLNRWSRQRPTEKRAARQLYAQNPCKIRAAAGRICIYRCSNRAKFLQNENDVHSPQAEGVIKAFLERISEITAFSNPLVNSYVRFGEDEAPKYITWSHENRSQLIRIPPATGQHARMELRSPDPACNPYVTLALLIYAGLEGIEEQKKLCPPTNLNLRHADAGLRCALLSTCRIRWSRQFCWRETASLSRG